jgi:1-deoxy-D-xylulose 5-phosphate reductoisomerase
VLNAVVGFAGLPATIAALEAGKRLALANKESLIAAGPVVAKARAAGGGEIVPVDSEHSAVWQCLRSGRHTEVARIILTASGGPFRGPYRRRPRDRDARRRAPAPDVDDGRQDHDRLVDAHEQGTRGDRGA